ncbi:MAG: hypothetical protein AAFX05_06880 [Planctomycetota bacterium]
MQRIAIVSLLVVTPTLADSNVADTHKYAWAENVGWTNWRDADAGADGVRVYHDSHLEGWVWGENVGWIHVGDGNAPYANTNHLNYGVNINPATGDMTGFAWAENVGWINFGPFPLTTTVPSARWEPSEQRMRGYAWGENIGWLNLNDASVGVCAIPGDNDSDGAVTLSDFTILASNFGVTGVTPFTDGDATGDGDVNLADFTSLANFFGFVCP